jgi:tetratricopeptide (TPR) repeat protein
MTETENPASQDTTPPLGPEPRRARRFALRWLPLIVVGVALVGGIAWLAFRKAGPAPEIAQARELLQLCKFQAASDVLGQQKSAEGLYLKAIALNGLNQREAAIETIRKAHKLEPTDPRYEGFLLLMRLGNREEEAADELIDLYEQNRSYGSLALFAATAEMMKGDRAKSMATFDAAVALASETPEFMFQTLDHAVTVGRLKAADELLGKLRTVRPKDPDAIRLLLHVALRARLGKSSEMLLTQLQELTPDDPELEKIRVRILFYLGSPEALPAAEKLYRDRGETEDTAMLYILPLSLAPFTPENDRQFRGMMRRFPRNMEIFARYMIYLTQAGRLEEALDQINRALASSSTQGPARTHLLELAIGLPLEKENPELLERELERHQSEVTDSQLVGYLRGRLHVMRKEYEPALAEFKKVIEAEKANKGAPRSIAADSLVWMRKILVEQRIEEQLDKVTEAIDLLDERKPPETKPE